MYNYPFKENEEYVISEHTDVISKLNCREFIVNILLTNKNILIFYSANKDNLIKNYKEHTFPEYEIIYKIKLNNMNYKIDNKNTILIINGNKLTLYNFNIKEFIEKDD